MSAPSTAAGPRVPDWIVTLETEGRAREEKLRAALQAADGDPRRAGQWLVDNGCVSPRDLVLAQAESFGIPFIDPGDYRVNLENRRLIQIGQKYLFAGEWWIAIFPGITLAALVLAVNLLGDWLRDALNPRLR